MGSMLVNIGRIFVVMLILLWSSPASLQEGEGEAKKPSGVASDLDAGKHIYEKRCSHCHGIEGRGDGVAADRFRPRPANFARAKYKYASTEKDELPTDEDLLKTVSKGLPGTGMPAWESVLSEKERMQVVQYIKAFSDKFAEAGAPPKKIDFGKKIPFSKESVEQGKELFFKKAECNRCHGDEGRADGKNAAELPVWPRNLTKGWTFRRSNDPEEIFQRISRGIIVMPSFAKGENVETTEEERWHIANYVHSLSQYKGKPEWKVTLIAKKIEGEVPSDPDDLRWGSQEMHGFPLVGQVTVEPRMFTPTVDMVTAKAVYNDKAVSFLVVWDDPTHSVAGAMASEEVSGEVSDTSSEGAKGEASPVYDDAVAMQFPAKMPEGAQKPYFVMGDLEHATYLAKWDSGAGRVVEMSANGQDRVVVQEASQFSGKGVYKNGQYRVVFTRPLTAVDKETDIPFVPGEFIPIAFTAWDGSNGEKEGMRSLSAWYHLLLELPTPPERYIYPTVLAVLVIGLEFWIARKYKNGNAHSGKGKTGN